MTTEDGYILTLHRIPHGRRKERSRKQRPVVFLNHCILCSSAVFILTGPEKALGKFLLIGCMFTRQKKRKKKGKNILT